MTSFSDLLQPIRNRLSAASEGVSAVPEDPNTPPPSEPVYTQFVMLSRARPLHEHAPQDLATLLPLVEVQAKCLNWINMSSGIAGDGNHVDPIRAHKENTDKIAEAFAECEKIAGGKT